MTPSTKTYERSGELSLDAGHDRETLPPFNPRSRARVWMERFPGLSASALIGAVAAVLVGSSTPPPWRSTGSPTISAPFSAAQGESGSVPASPAANDVVRVGTTVLVPLSSLTGIPALATGTTPSGKAVSLVPKQSASKAGATSVQSTPPGAPSTRKARVDPCRGNLTCVMKRAVAER